MTATVYFLSGRIEQHEGHNIELDTDYTRLLTVTGGGNRETFSLDGAFKVEIVL